MSTLESDEINLDLTWSKLWASWHPLVITTSTYCLIIFLIGFATSSGPGMIFFFLGISISFSMTQLTAIFAALGPGGYLTRLVISQACGSLFLFSLFGGFAASGQVMPRGIFDSFLVAAIVGSASAQMIYGIFRLSRGWQVHPIFAKRGPAYTLKDLFALTLFVATLLSILNLNQSKTGPEDSLVRLSLSVFVFISVGTLVFGLPTLATTLRLQKVENGCWIQLMIAAAILFVVLLPVLSIGSPIDVSIPVVVAICSISLFTWLPLTMLRNQGIVLTRSGDRLSDG